MKKVTREAVFAAADSIKRAGNKPAVRSVLKELGSGSNSTISPLLREWRDAQSKLDNAWAACTERQREDLVTHTAAIFSEGVDAGVERLSEERHRLEETIDQLKQDVALSETKINECADELQAVNEKNELLCEQVVELKSELKVASELRIAAEEQRDKAVVTADEAKDQLAELKGELKVLKRSDAH